MKVKEVRGLKPEELKKQLGEAYKQLFDLKLKLETKQLVNHREIPRLKRDIARLKTIIREKELEIR